MYQCREYTLKTYALPRVVTTELFSVCISRIMRRSPRKKQGLLYSMDNFYRGAERIIHHRYYFHTHDQIRFSTDYNFSFSNSFYCIILAQEDYWVLLQTFDKYKLEIIAKWLTTGLQRVIFSRSIYHVLQKRVRCDSVATKLFIYFLRFF